MASNCTWAVFRKTRLVRRNFGRIRKIAANSRLADYISDSPSPRQHTNINLIRIIARYCCKECKHWSLHEKCYSRLKSCILSGRCKPIFIADVIAIELSVTDVSFVDLAVGNSHRATSKIACTVDILCKHLDISVHINFITHSDRIVNSVVSSW